MTRASNPSESPGVFVIDKLAGITSFDVVRSLGRRLGTRKVGHCGTLDPMATGVMVVCVQEATRLVPWLTADDKVYSGTLQFGAETDTDDQQGQVTRSREDTFAVDPLLVTECARRLLGAISQVPPAFSAIHVDGQRAYALARAGVSVELAPREVRVDSFDVTLSDDGLVRFTASVSKGTYIRSLARDLGRSTGYLAHLTSLRRERSGAFGLEHALPAGWQELSPDELRAFAVAPYEALGQMPELELSPEERVRLSHGKLLEFSPDLAAGLYRTRTSEGSLFGVIRLDTAGVARVERLMPTG